MSAVKDCDPCGALLSVIHCTYHLEEFFHREMDGRVTVTFSFCSNQVPATSTPLHCQCLLVVQGLLGAILSTRTTKSLHITSSVGLLKYLKEHFHYYNILSYQHLCWLLLQSRLMLRFYIVKKIEN